MGLVAGSAALAQQHLANTPLSRAPASMATIASSTPAPAAAVAPAIAVEPPRVEAVPPASLPDEAPAPIPTDSLLSPADGIVTSVLVAPGEAVFAGDTLATIVSSDAAAVLAQLASDVERAREETRSSERALAAAEEAVAAAVAARDAAAAATPAPRASEVDEQTRAALAHAQKVYNDAIARERRAATLEAFGVQASQELEESQMAVRAAAAEVATLRRALESMAAAAQAEAEAARTQSAARVTALQQERAARAAALGDARLRQREAEVTLASARERLATAVRSRLAGTVVTSAARPGSRVSTGTPLFSIAPQ
jgi:multidrug resistance efflux pump